MLKRLGRYREVFEGARSVLEIMRNLKESRSGLLGLGLAGVASIGPLMDLLAIWEPSEHQLLSSGYRLPFQSYSLNQLAKNLVVEKAIRPEGRKCGGSEEFTLYEWDSGNVVLLCYSEGYSVLYVKDVERFKVFLKGILYNGGSHLYMVGVCGEEDDRIEVGVYGELPVWVGEPSPMEVSGRFHGGRGSLLLVGPSGVGKSLLARHLCRVGKSLTVSWDVLERGEGVVVQLLLLVDVLAPEVVILDDIPIEGCRRLLSLMESLHERDIKVVLTLMTEVDVIPGRGVLFINGLRPGRVDDVVLLSTPDRGRRRELLGAFGISGEVLEYCVEHGEGLTPAYLWELSRRVLRCGSSYEVEEELERLMLLAPPTVRRFPKDS